MKIRGSLLQLILVASIVFICSGSNVSDTDVTVVVCDYNKKHLVKVQLNGSQVTEVDEPEVHQPVSISYRHLEDTVYFSHFSPHEIKKANVNGTTVTTVATLPSSARPYGLTVAVDSSLLFFTDWARDIVVSIDLSDSRTKTILGTSTVRDPHQITVHEIRRRIIWADKKSGFKISSSNYDGSDIDRIVSVSTYSYGLAVDTEDDVLYWSESSAGTIQSVAMDGSNKKEIFRDLGMHLYDLRLHGSTLFFTARRRRIHYVSVDGGKAKEIATKIDFTFPHGICVIPNKRVEPTPALTTEEVAPSTSRVTTTTTIAPTIPTTSATTRLTATKQTTRAITSATTKFSTIATTKLTTSATTKLTTKQTTRATTKLTKLATKANVIMTMVETIWSRKTTKRGTVRRATSASGLKGTTSAASGSTTASSPGAINRAAAAVDDDDDATSDEDDDGSLLLALGVVERVVAFLVVFAVVVAVVFKVRKSSSSHVLVWEDARETFSDLKYNNLKKAHLSKN